MLRPMTAIPRLALLALAAGCASGSQTPAGAASTPAASPPPQAVPAPQPTPAAKAVARPQAAPAAGARTTLSGIYTLDQAKRGADVYAASCGSCHSPSSHTGNTFKAGWVGRPLSELFNYLSSEMPQNDPGSLDMQQYADVTAYILRLNAMPTGDAELPPNADSLTTIQISLAPPSSPAGKSPHHH